MKQYDFTKDPERQGDDAVTVGRTRKRKLDLIPRLVCLLLALLIWIYMVNLNDTDVTEIMTLKIDMVGEEELLDDENLLIYGLDKDTVTVTVKGSQRDLKKYTEADYHCTVDVRAIKAAGRHSLPLNIQTPIGSSITVAGADPGSVAVYSDVKLTKSVKLDVVRGDMTTVSSYTYEILQDADYVDITGPSAMLNSIESARYTVSGEFYSSKNFSGFSLEFCDKNGDLVSFEAGAISYSTANATVRVKVTHKVPLDIRVVVNGIGETLVAIPSVKTITVVGDPTLLTELYSDNKYYTIELTEAILGRDTVVTITESALPAGVTLEGGDVEVTIRFENPKK